MQPSQPAANQLAGNRNDKHLEETVIHDKVRTALTPLAAAAMLCLAAGTPLSAEEITKIGSVDVADLMPDYPDSKVMVDTAPFKKDGPWVIGYADASLANSWRIMAKASVDWGIAKTGGKATLAYTNANDSAAKQIADIEDLLTQKVDAIILAATDPNALCPSIDKAVKQGVPVLILERDVNCKGYTTFLNARNVQNGLLQGAYVADKLGGKGDVVIIGGIQGMGSTVTTIDAMNKVFERYPDIKVVATEYADYQPAKCKQAMNALLTRFDKIDAVISISGNQGVGCFEAVKQAGRVEEVKAWTGDDANGWMKIVAQEKIPSIITPIPTYSGMHAVEEAVKILSGEQVPRDFLVPKPSINSDNIGEFAKMDRPDEWWYPAGLPCEYDPYCKK